MEYELECEDCGAVWKEPDYFLMIARCPACDSERIIDVFDASV
jgi:predicted Zn-ribbon and HTH transcriptional regulator